MSNNMDRRKFLGVLGSGAAATALVGEGVVHAASQASTSITINGASSGSIFDGIGAISGGGGTTRTRRMEQRPAICAAAPTRITIVAMNGG